MTINWPLARCGVMLFLFGLILGFVVPIFANRHIAVGAHETALESGTFLIAISSLWSGLHLAPKWSHINARLLSISLCAVVLALTLSATLAATDAAGLMRKLLLVLNAGSSVIMLAVVVALALALRKPPANKTREL